MTATRVTDWQLSRDEPAFHKHRDLTLSDDAGCRRRRVRKF
jgi:hypothetical protein